MACGCAHRQLVAKGAKAGDDADRDVREIGVPPERLTRVSVREVQLYKWQPYGRDSVPQRHTRVGERGGIQDQKADAGGRRAVDAIDELVLGVALEHAQLESDLAGHLGGTLLDGLERFHSVDAGLAGAEQIQIWAVQQQHSSHLVH